MAKFRLNLAVAPGDERIQTGYEQIQENANCEEAIGDYMYWLIQEGFEDDDVAGRILCDAEDTGRGSQGCGSDTASC